jgi:Cof subfamily protein (haloacid dehalogenase superfamily)
VIRLVACDLDGTLVVRDNRLSDRSAAAVARAQAAGIHVVAATGRPWQWTLDLAQRHQLLPTAVCSNGACLADVVTGDVAITGLPDGAAHALLERARATVPGIRFAIDAREGLAYEPGFLDSEPMLGESVVPTVAELLSTEVVKVIARVPGTNGVDLAEMLDDRVLDGVAVPFHAGGEWVELLAAGVSKASGLATVCAALGIDAGEVVAVGDGINDVPMLEWAGTGVAVEGSPEPVLAAADRVVPGGESEGVAALLEELAGLSDQAS